MRDNSNVSNEVELTYLAREIPFEIHGISPESMVDIYIPKDSTFPELRARKKDNTYEITKKVPANMNDFSIYPKQTILLNAEDFLAPSRSSARVVKKDGYTVRISKKIAEVDMFKDDLEGLVLIDFEFKNREEGEQFIAPSCCLINVTQELFIAGGQLVGKSYAHIKNKLAPFGYKSLSMSKS